MSITIKFPHNEDVSLEKGKSVVILGANGAGKTRLGARIEELNDKRSGASSETAGDVLIHRITAQKSLNIYDVISLVDYESSWRAVYLGDVYEHATKHGSRFGGQPATYLLDDFNKVLAHLFAKENKQLQDAHIAEVKAKMEREHRPDLITTIRETVTEIWNYLLPNRKIDLTGNTVSTEYKEEKYHGKNMSDGERVILYMICQVLLLPPSSVIIIDEPEIHIHKAILKKLWDRLEVERDDCAFLYITHDLDFAASRNSEKVLWIKNYDGKDWEYEFLNINDFSQLPPELLFELIGTKKKVLFVEGEQNSYDYALYTEFFREKDYHVIPCGGCQEVVRIYKAKKAYEALSGIEVHCLIDRDYRTDLEIEALKKDGVEFLNVAEVENLFIIPELLEIMEKQLGCDNGTAKRAEDFIVCLFNSNKNNQIRESFLGEVNHQLTLLNYSDKNLTLEEIRRSISDRFCEANMQIFFDDKERIFASTTDVISILRVFNFKKLSCIIGSKFGLHGKEAYPKRVLNLLKTNPDGVRERILSALKQYIPDLS